MMRFMVSMMNRFANPSARLIYSLAGVAAVLLAITILMINFAGEDIAMLAFLPLLFGMTALFIAAVLFLLRALNRAEDRSSSGN
jgi:ABC-type polysaccharide/polyol phosphate export permease